MILATHLFRDLVPPLGGTVIVIAMLVLGIALLFAGKSLVKAIVFIVAGLFGALIGASIGAALGPLGIVLGAIGGFIVAGLLGYFLLHVGIGLGLGFLAFATTRSYTGGLIIPLVIAVVFFVIGVILTDQILELATALLGGFLIYEVAILFNVPDLIAVLGAGVLVVLGFWVQHKRQPRKPEPTPPASTPTPSP
jgi:hypothetical protein